MINHATAYRVGTSHAAYLVAQMQYKAYYGVECADIAIHLRTLSLNNGNLQLDIGVKTRPKDDIGTWWTINELTESQMENYIAEVKTFQNSEGQFPFVVNGKV